jgi:hypothetical protein
VRSRRLPTYASLIADRISPTSSCSGIWLFFLSISLDLQRRNNTQITGNVDSDRVNEAPSWYFCTYLTAYITRNKM